jgi:adenylate cyclase
MTGGGTRSAAPRPRRVAAATTGRRTWPGDVTGGSAANGRFGAADGAAGHDVSAVDRERENIDEAWLGELTGAEREQRRELLVRLLRDGFTRQDIERALAEDRLALLPVDRVLGATLTAEEIEAQSGLAAERMIRTRRLLGLPEPAPRERVFSTEDVEAARATKLFLDAGIPGAGIDEVTAVLGEGMARVAATITGVFFATYLQAGDSEQEVAERFAALAEQLTPLFAPVLVSAFSAQLRAGVQRGVLGREQLETGEQAVEHELAVCFADLVGFTRLGGEVELGELGSVAGRFARVAAETVRPPVRLIKTIGDGAMFISPDPEAMVAVALALVAAAQEQDLPSLRAGISLGPAVQRAGDYYGHTVNVASRVTGVARPGSVLTTKDVMGRCAEAFDWSAAGRHRLKGVSGSVGLFRPRPLQHGSRGSS